MNEYPATRRDDVVEDHFGHEVADPYRWLEDADSAETADWVSRQRAFSEAALGALPERAWFADVMARIVGRPRAGIPRVQGGRYFLNRNDGRQAQDVWYVADSLDELVAGGRLVLDPNRWTPDGTDSLGFFTVSDDGRFLAQGVSEGGSDWRRISVLDLTRGERLDEPDVVGRFTSAEWLPDNASYLYSTYAEAADARGTATRVLGAARLMLHRLGSADDELVLTFPDDPQLMPWAEVSHDGRWLVVSIVRGTENRNRVWVYPIVTRGGRSELGDPVRVVDEAVAEFAFVRVDGGRLLLRTDLDALRGRIVAVDLDAGARPGSASLAEVVPEGPDTLAGAVASADALYLEYLTDAVSRLQRASPAGRDLGDVDLPAGGLVGIDASPKRREVYAGVSTIDAPTAAFDVTGGRAVPLNLAGDVERIAPPYTVGRRRATSKDGTPVPYFLIRADPAAPAADAVATADLLTEDPAAPGSEALREETPLDAGEAEGPPVLTAVASPVGGDDAAVVPASGEPAVREGPRPTMLYGYGGFKVPVLPDYRPGWPAWLAAGGVLAIATLRGGGEFGTDWYEDGRLANKQHVFDDAIAVAEDLIATGVTTRSHLAVHGRSNGGLLAGALLTQRADLFAAVLPSVGVLDLLRYHRFTIGSAWMSDYGDPDTKEGFEVAYTYSPLHNVDPGVAYPATLISTADHDDRVVPLHSFKFAATLQERQAGEAPVLLRIESAAGHGVGKPSAMVAAEWADLLAFAAHHTHLEVPPGPPSPR